MAEVKLTKNELRNEQAKLSQLLKYLPTLQLKKALLQAEVSEAKHEMYSVRDQLEIERAQVEEYAALLSVPLSIDLERFCRVREVKKKLENIAGADVPVFISCSFEPITYDLFETPIWLEAAIAGLRAQSRLKAHITIIKEKLEILEKELLEVSIRVNLFEKILIPRCEKNIKKIKIFLGDQLLSAVAQAKVAKTKIQEKKREKLCAST